MRGLLNQRLPPPKRDKEREGEQVRKILEEGQTVCLTCGNELDGVLIDYEAERGEAEPDCDVCLK